MRQYGRFTVAMDFFVRLQADEGTNLFHRMVVLRTQEHWNQDMVEYFAIHPSFRDVPLGEVVPEYKAIFHAKEIYPEWVEVKS